MRHRTRPALIALIAVLVLSGFYTAVWFVFAYQIENGFIDWARSAQTNRLDISWQRIGVGGFPVALRVKLDNAKLTDRAIDPPLTVSAPTLWATASPWDFLDWRLAASNGLTVAWEGDDGRPPVRLEVPTATAAISASLAGGARVWLTLHDSVASGTARIRAKLAHLWLIFPEAPPRTESGPLVAAALDLQAIELPLALRRFGGGSIDRIALGLTARGPFPDGPLRQAAMSWRNAGGTVELDRLRIDWGVLSATASGTFALDQDLQPECALSGSVEGFDQLIEALVRSGMMPARNAGLARLALTILARTGPDGRPRITTSFRIQGGQMALGPIRLGPAPHIDWP